MSNITERIRTLVSSAIRNNEIQWPDDQKRTCCKHSQLAMC
jgi:hypothetical protein